MEYFLLRLSYSTSGWRGIQAEGAAFDARLDKVRQLIASLGGSFANFHFHDRAPFDQAQEKSPPIRDKFAVFGGHDLLAILAMPTKIAAQSFAIALRGSDHIGDVQLTALMPWEDTIDHAAPGAVRAVSQSGFSGPAAGASHGQK